MDTRLLRSFLAVVRTGGITAAAAELSYAQSTVTAHVQALERSTGARLLDRSAAGAVATSAGARLAEHARHILDLEDRMFAELAAADRTPAGEVRLRAPESVCAYRLPGVLRGLSERYPDVRLSLAPAATGDALSAVADRRADLALVFEPSVSGNGLDVVDLGPQHLSLVAAPTTGLPRERRVTAAELAEAGALLLEEGCGYSDELAALLSAAAPAAAPTRFGSVETVKRCVAAGLGVALLPTPTVEEEITDGRLVELHGPRTSEHHLWLVRSATRWASPAVMAVHSLLRT
ncbi:DNA-binding transcriptional LysR family regulator [Saccharopolyspora erythraea NRRL 2338]|uniref:LysR-family transcriptional regulator n=2 Tax=Saccharopolyspora erythraea TaxID=1836 RepID=A4FKJ7_SACEN|nr:LysR family transcriptional regulator [Saccharopolyspora erythraea]EQD82919.1 LysR family transcriptional regulator [Saccharopolyspora erythraea D]PFG98210.1 DNA-binding transcriptional LysR family regulator [Saccharopolyspora erythraea NRRL 2338]QRK88309.1 LysR family transcriptional regulator [Saccharopolyspora erythraea]CAM04572.1 LysR-family transcriptional regulator [Saccharopolyspora erythraea NRRL 2338]